MTRGLSVGMTGAVDDEVIRPVWIIRLDIKDDPVYVWTGRGTFVPTGTGDAALDGFSFLGLGNVGEISPIKDTDSGSQAVTLSLPGMKLDDVYLQQIVADSRTWQFRRGWIWLGLRDSSLGVVANPTRIKTGRMDQMKLDADGKTGSILVTLESHQSYVSEPLGSRYINQADIDPADISQFFVHDLANRRAGIGERGASVEPPPGLEARNAANYYGGGGGGINGIGGVGGRGVIP